MKILLYSFILLLLVLDFETCRSRVSSKQRGTADSFSNTTSTTSLNLDGISFKFLKEQYVLKQREQIQVRISFINQSTSSVYVADWSSWTQYYWQRENVITASFLPFGYRKPKDGVGVVSASPSVLRPCFRELKPGENLELTIHVPKGTSEEWWLAHGKWRIWVQHLWVSDVEPFKNLAGEKLVEALEKKGHLVWAAADLIVE